MEPVAWKSAADSQLELLFVCHPHNTVSMCKKEDNCDTQLVSFYLSEIQVPYVVVDGLVRVCPHGKMYAIAFLTDLVRKMDTYPGYVKGSVMSRLSVSAPIVQVEATNAEEAGRILVTALDWIQGTLVIPANPWKLLDVRGDRVSVNLRLGNKSKKVESVTTPTYSYRHLPSWEALCNHAEILLGAHIEGCRLALRAPKRVRQLLLDEPPHPPAKRKKTGHATIGAIA